MSDRIRVELERIGESFNRIAVVLWITDSTLLGQQATFEVRRTIRVKDSRPVHGSMVIASKKLTLNESMSRHEFSLGDGPVFTYEGQHIAVDLVTRLELFDGWVWNTTLDQQHDLDLGLMATDVPTNIEIVNPEDIFSLLTSYRALNWSGRARVMLIGLVCALMAIPLALLGLHDLVASQAWVAREAGDAFFLGIGALLVDGAIGLGGWALIKRELMRYCTLEALWPQSVGMDTRIPVHNLVRGVSRVPLHGARLRVIACNQERGQYRRGSGTDVRTVSFSQPARTIILYDQVVDSLPAGMPIEEAFSGEVDFGTFFFAILPPQIATTAHGLDLHWEIQLLHDDYLDHDLVGPTDIFRFEELWNV